MIDFDPFIYWLTQMFLIFVGHGGQDEPEEPSSEIPSLRENESIYNLDGQTQHKVCAQHFHIEKYGAVF